MPDRTTKSEKRKPELWTDKLKGKSLAKWLKSSLNLEFLIVHSVQCNHCIRIMACAKVRDKRRLLCACVCVCRFGSSLLNVIVKRHRSIAVIKHCALILMGPGCALITDTPFVTFCCSEVSSETRGRYCAISNVAFFLPTRLMRELPSGFLKHEKTELIR